MPYAYPAAATLPGSDAAAKDDKSAATHAFQATAVSSGLGAAQPTLRVRFAAPRLLMLEGCVATYRC